MDYQRIATTTSVMPTQTLITVKQASVLKSSIKIISDALHLMPKRDAFGLETVLILFAKLKRKIRNLITIVQLLSVKPIQQLDSVHLLLKNVLLMLKNALGTCVKEMNIISILSTAVKHGAARLRTKTNLVAKMPLLQLKPIHGSTTRFWKRINQIPQLPNYC